MTPARTNDTDLRISKTMFFQCLHFFLEQLLHSVLGDEDMGNLHLELFRGFGTRAMLDRRELEGLPGRWLDALLDPSHRQLEQLAIEGVFHLLFQVGHASRESAIASNRLSFPADLNRWDATKSFQALWVTVLSQARKLREGSYWNFLMAVSNLSKTSCATSSASDGCAPHFRHHAQIAG